MQEYEDLKVMVAEIRVTSTRQKVGTRPPGLGFANRCRKSNKPLSLFAAAFLKSGRPSKLRRVLDSI